MGGLVSDVKPEQSLYGDCFETSALDPLFVFLPDEKDFAEGWIHVSHMHFTRTDRPPRVDDATQEQ